MNNNYVVLQLFFFNHSQSTLFIFTLCCDLQNQTLFHRHKKVSAQAKKIMMSCHPDERQTGEFLSFHVITISRGNA